jgi:hypothetical protein
MARTFHTYVPEVHNLLGIDCETETATKLYHRLAALKSMVGIARPDPYREDPSYCQIRVTTTMTEAELDNWLWKTKHGAEYVGVFTR